MSLHYINMTYIVSNPACLIDSITTYPVIVTDYMNDTYFALD